MALQKEEDLYGIKIQAYIKLIGSDTREDGEFEDGTKRYYVNAYLNYCTDNTKAFVYKQEIETIKDLKETELTLPIIYAKIMAMEKFKTAAFV